MYVLKIRGLSDSATLRRHTYTYLKIDSLYTPVLITSPSLRGFGGILHFVQKLSFFTCTWSALDFWSILTFRPKWSFEVYNICVAQKLQISEFLIVLFFTWTQATSATFQGRNFNLNRVSSLSWICQLSYETLFVVWKENWEGLDYVSQIGWIPPPLGIQMTK